MGSRNVGRGSRETGPRTLAISASSSASGNFGAQAMAQVSRGPKVPIEC